MAEIKAPQPDTFFKSNNIVAEIKFSPTLEQRLNNDLGLHSPLQKFWDNMILGNIQPYVPLLTGALIASSIENTMVGSGEIIYRTPYARRQYWEGREPGESQTGALRGRLWAERAKNDLFPQWASQAQAFLSRR